MKICVIGNSHAGAWKLAWDKIARIYPGVSIRFFAAGGATLQHLHADRGLLRTHDAYLAQQLKITGGSETIDPGEYDRFCLIGCRVVPQPVLMLYEGRRAETSGSLADEAVESPSPDRAPVSPRMADPLVMLYEAWRAESHKGRAGDPTFVSDACFEAAARGLVSDSLGIKLCRELAKLTARPITLVPQPMPSETILSSATPRHAVWRMAHEAGDDGALSALFTRLVRELCPGQVEPMEQPPATLFAPMLTLERYSRDFEQQARAGGNDQPPDYFHMRSAFGRLAVADYLASFGITAKAGRKKRKRKHTPVEQAAERTAAPAPKEGERAPRAARKARPRAPVAADDDALVCEENLLEAFGR